MSLLGFKRTRCWDILNLDFDLRNLDAGNQSAQNAVHVEDFRLGQFLVCRFLPTYAHATNSDTANRPLDLGLRKPHAMWIPRMLGRQNNVIAIMQLLSGGCASIRHDISPLHL
jgi:hypothetical protein